MSYITAAETLLLYTRGLENVSGRRYEKKNKYKKKENRENVPVILNRPSAAAATAIYRFHAVVGREQKLREMLKNKNKKYIAKRVENGGDKRIREIERENDVTESKRCGEWNPGVTGTNDNNNI